MNAVGVPPELSRKGDASRQLASLDFVRAFAALGVVLLHACAPYMAHPMPGLVWATRDTPSALADWLGWGIELFIMPLFLLMSGFLAWNTLQRRGTRDLVVSRTKRLLVPFLFGCIVILPIDLHVWVLGWVVDGLVPLVKLRSFKFDGVIDQNLWGTGHLWFLQYVFLYVIGLSLWSWIRRGASRFTRPSGKTSMAGTSLDAAGLLAAAVLTVYWCPQVVWGFQHAAWPIPSKFVYSGLFFVGGCLLSARDPGMQRLAGSAPKLTIGACALAGGAMLVGDLHLSGQLTPGGRAVLAVLTATAGTAVSLSILGLAQRWVKGVSAGVRYLAAASFWVYLVHHPILGLVHIDLKLLLPDVDPALKLLLAFGVSASLALLMYEGLIRTTAFGRWIGLSSRGQASPERPVRDAGDPASSCGRMAA